MELLLAAIVGVLGGVAGGALGTVLFPRQRLRDSDVDELATTVGRLAKEFRRIRMRDVRAAAGDLDEGQQALPLPTPQLTHQQIKEQLRKQVIGRLNVAQTNR